MLLNTLTGADLPLVRSDYKRIEVYIFYNSDRILIILMCDVLH
jgi:hypothetical protein